MLAGVNVTKVKPLLQLTAEDHKWLREHYFSYIHSEPLFRRETEEEKQRKADEFVHQVRKVPVFWVYDEYERGFGQEFIYWYVNLIYSDGEKIHQDRTPGAECPVTITDAPESFAYLQLREEEGPRILAICFNPYGGW